jgi:hypothetical protein
MGKKQDESPTPGYLYNRKKSEQEEEEERRGKRRDFGRWMSGRGAVFGSYFERECWRICALAVSIIMSCFSGSLLGFNAYSEGNQKEEE